MFGEIFGIKRDNLADRLQSQMRDTVEAAVATAIRKVRGDIDRLSDIEALRDAKLKLEEEIEKLKISKARKEEEFERREREIEHKVGLERQRQEQEITLAKKEAKIEARENNLDQREEQFKERMEFFKEQLGKQEGMLESVLERLPSASLIANIGRENGSND